MSVKRLRFFVQNIEEIICVLCLAIMSALIVMQVFFRYILNNSLSWSEELARYFFIWLIYIGISYGVKLDKHICVDAVYSVMPKRVKPYYALIGIIAFLIYSIVIVYFGVQVTFLIAKSGQISTGAHIPMQFVYAAPAVGMALTTIRLIEQLVHRIRDIRSEKAFEREE